MQVCVHGAEAGTGGNHGESAASSRGARGQSMDVDVERAEELAKQYSKSKVIYI